MKGKFPIDRMQSIETPFYYYDTDLLRKTLRSINDEVAKHDNFMVHYAIKANANPKVLNIICQVLHRAQDTIEPIVVNEVMQEILSYVNQHFTTPIKLDALARNFGVSVSFLSHEFVKYTGRSVYDYVLYRRILLAKELISSAIPLNEVAFQCGFNDYSSFLRSFTKMAGMSPSAYRKSVQGAY